MLSQQPAYAIGFKPATGQATLLEKERFDTLEMSHQPTAPRCGEAHLGPVDDRFREQVANRGLEHLFAVPSPHEVAGWYGSGKFHEPVIEKRNPALDGSCHTHLVLF